MILNKYKSVYSDKTNLIVFNPVIYSSVTLSEGYKRTN